MVKSTGPLYTILFKKTNLLDIKSCLIFSNFCLVYVHVYIYLHVPKVHILMHTHFNAYEMIALTLLVLF